MRFGYREEILVDTGAAVARGVVVVALVAQQPQVGLRAVLVGILQTFAHVEQQGIGITVTVIVGQIGIDCGQRVVVALPLGRAQAVDAALQRGGSLRAERAGD